MKYCTKCGKELLDEAEVCPGCGCFTGTLMQGTQKDREEQPAQEKKQNPETQHQVCECGGKCAKYSRTIAVLNFLFSFKAILAVFCLLYAVSTFNLETACAVFAFLFSIFTFILGIVVFAVSLAKPKCKAILPSLTRLITGLFLCILSIVFLAV